jgi:DNA-binding LacI/PurR family transcriptional regulator
MSVTRKSEAQAFDGRSSLAAEELIARGIRNGDYAPGRYLPPLRELSRVHGFATETFRNALLRMQNDGVLLSKPRRGFVVLRKPDRRHRDGTSHTILFSGPPGPPNEWTYTDKLLLLEAQDFAAKHDLAVLTVSCADKPSSRIREQIETKGLGGAMLVRPSDPFSDLVRKRGIPMTLIGGHPKTSEADAVVQDNFTGGTLAAEYLADRGHERIAWIGPCRGSVDRHALERYSGVAGELARRRMRLPEDLIVDDVQRHETENLYERVKDLLASSRRPTAIIALWLHRCDVVARALDDLGLRIGRDLDMVGWCPAEQYDSGFVPLFRNGDVPPAAVWSVKDMVALCYSRLVERRAKPDMPISLTRVPVRLQVGKE